MIEYEPDPYDPSDDIDAPAVLDPDLDTADPVELVETDDAPAAPPETWAAELTEEDWQERLDGVDFTDDPADGEPGDK